MIQCSKFEPSKEATLTFSGCIMGTVGLRFWIKANSVSGSLSFSTFSGNGTVQKTFSVAVVRSVVSYPVTGISSSSPNIACLHALATSLLAEVERV